MERVSWSRQGGSRRFYLNRFDAEGEFRYPAHDHEDHWEFVYVVSGSFRHEIGGARRTHEAGRLILVRDADVHSLRGRDFSYVNLAFPPAWLDRFGEFSGNVSLRADLEQRGIAPEALVPEAERAVLVARFDALMRAAGEVGGGTDAFAALFPLLVSYLAEPADEAYPSAPDAASAVRLSDGIGPIPPRWLTDLVAWASARNRPPDNEEFVRKSGYSAEHVIRTLRRHYGITPSRLLADLRLRRAEDLLRFTNYSVARIAEESGWTGVRHFERRFRERCGRSPRDYRKANAILAH